MTYEDITGIGESLSRIADALEALVEQGRERVELQRQGNAVGKAILEAQVAQAGEGDPQ